MNWMFIVFEYPVDPEKFLSNCTTIPYMQTHNLMVKPCPLYQNIMGVNLISEPRQHILLLLLTAVAVGGKMTRRNKSNGRLDIVWLVISSPPNKWGEQRSDKQQTNETSCAFPLTLESNTRTEIIGQTWCVLSMCF